MSVLQVLLTAGEWAGLIILFVIESILIMGPLVRRVFPKAAEKSKIGYYLLVFFWFAVVIFVFALLVVYSVYVIGLHT